MTANETAKPGSRIESERARNWCRQGLHDVMVGGQPMCCNCGELVGSVIAGEPYDYSHARRDIESVHALLFRYGLLQSEGDGQWGYITGYETQEWSEVGNTVQAIQHVMQGDAMGVYYKARAEAEGSGTARSLADALRDLIEEVRVYTHEDGTSMRLAKAAGNAREVLRDAEIW